MIAEKWWKKGETVKLCCVGPDVRAPCRMSGVVGPDVRAKAGCPAPVAEAKLELAKKRMWRKICGESGNFVEKRGERVGKS